MVNAKVVVVSIVAVLSACLQLKIKAQSTIDVSPGDDSCAQPEVECEFQAEENMRLRSELEKERRRRRPVTATILSNSDITWNISSSGFAKVGDWIYALSDNPEKIQIYEDRNDFRLIREIALNGTNFPYDIVYSDQSKCVYISDIFKECIWKMTTTTNDSKLTKWLSNVTMPCTLSLSNEGHLLVLKGSLKQLEIYSLNATLVRRLQLQQEYEDARHVVETSSGNFIICHRLSNAFGEPWVISQMTNDGQLINRFIPRSQWEKLDRVDHLSLDSDNNRLFVADSSNFRVILFDSSDLTWRQVLVYEGIEGLKKPWRLFYDASRKHLFVSIWHIRPGALIYKID